MSKQISIMLKGTITLPDGAEIIRFTDEEGGTQDHIKFAGRLLRPDFEWMEYHSSDVSKDMYPTLPLPSIGWESIDIDLYNDHFTCCDAEWYMEEKNA